MKKQATILFYGSLWGIAEATLGYILHLLHLPFTGLIMFPIGFYFMKKAQNETQQVSSIMKVALIASVIKLFNFFLPGAVFVQVFHPAISILLEGAFVAIFLAKPVKNIFMRALSASAGWRISFVMIAFIETQFGLTGGILASGMVNIIQFLVLSSVVNAFLIFALIKYVPMKSRKIKLKYAYSSLMIALILQFLI